MKAYERIYNFEHIFGRNNIIFPFEAAEKNSDLKNTKWKNTKWKNTNLKNTDLKKNYIDACLIDPSTGKPWKYISTGSNWHQAYSRLYNFDHIFNNYDFLNARRFIRQ